MSALDHIGELRATSSPKEKAAIILSSRSLPYFDELLQCARGYDPDVLSPDRLLQWVEWDGLERPFDSIWSVRMGDWAVKVCGVKIACSDTYDPLPVLRQWVTRPAWAVLDIWENCAFVKSSEGQRYRGLLRDTLEVLDAQFKHGQMSDLQGVKDVCYDAGRDCLDYMANTGMEEDSILAPGYVPFSVAKLVDEPPFNTQYMAVDVFNSLLFARYALGLSFPDSPEALEFRKHWHDDWTWHLLHDILS